MDDNRLGEVIRVRRDELILAWTVMTASIGVVALIASQLTYDKYPNERPTWLAAIFWLAAFALIVPSVTRPRKELTKAKLTALMRVTPESTDLAYRFRERGIDVALLREVNALEKNDQRLVGVVVAMLRPMMIGLIVSDVIAFVALIWALVAASFLAAFPLFVLAFALNAYHFPRVSSVLERAGKLVQDEEVAEFEKDLRKVEKGVSHLGVKRPSRTNH